MNRGPGLLMAIVCAALALVAEGWSRVACICAAVTCLCVYLKGRR